MAKEIELTNGKVAIVDDDDFERLNKWVWRLNERGYAVRKSRVGTIGRKSRSMSMHRFIMGDPEGFVVDHINGDQLDNRKSNLRTCTQSDNLANRRINSNNTSGYKGVHFNKKLGKYESSLNYKKQKYFLGLYECKHEAARAYNAKAVEVCGEYARLNDIAEGD